MTTLMASPTSLAPLRASSFTKRLGLGLAAAAIAAIPASEALAGAGDAFAVAGLGVGAVGIVDIGFLAYDVWQIEDDNEPDEGAMIAQTAVWAPQMALANALIVVGQVDKESGPVLTLVGLVPAVFTTGMTTFGAWSLANHDVPAGPRFGVSFMIGANFVLTTGAITTAFVGHHVASPWLAIPEIAIGSAQAVPSFVQAARDPDHRAAWIGLGAWSTAIVAHGAVSAVISANDRTSDDDVARPDGKKKEAGLPFVVAPTVYTEGATSMPGAVVVGMF